MAIDIVLEGQTIDPVEIAKTKLSKVRRFLIDNGFKNDPIVNEIEDVLDQLVGFCCHEARLGPLPPKKES